MLLCFFGENEKGWTSSNYSSQLESKHISVVIADEVHNWGEAKFIIALKVDEKRFWRNFISNFLRKLKISTRILIIKYQVEEWQIIISSIFLLRDFRSSFELPTQQQKLQVTFSFLPLSRTIKVTERKWILDFFCLSALLSLSPPPPQRESCYHGR